ncbi:MAG TPA: NAD-dependent epimerase/dehydratase family protein [Allosphingosinicella sp.]
MKILVLGGSGLLGRALIAHLGGGGHDVHAVVRSDAAALKVKAALPHATTLSLDQVSGQQFNRLVNLVVDYGRGGGALSGLLRTNLLYPLEVAERVEADAMINVSTALPEDYSGYAFSKKLLERSLDRFAAARGVRNVNVHLHNMYGPIFDETNLITAVLAKLRRGEPVELSSGQNSRDFIFADDVVEGLDRILSSVHELPEGAPVPLGSGVPTRLRDLVEMLVAKTGSNSPVLFGARPDNPLEPPALAADLSAMSAIGWSPQWPLERGIEAMLPPPGGQAPLESC